MNKNDTKTKNSSGNGVLKGENKNALEWSVFGISLTLLCAILVFLGYKTYTHQSSPAEVEVQFQPAATETAPFRYHVLVSNIGGETAENVLVEFELQQNDTTLEKSEIEFPYVPKSSKREGWIIFSTNPDSADSVTARVVSFKKPT